MSNQNKQRRRRPPRLDGSERARILAEITRLERTEPQIKPDPAPEELRAVIEEGDQRVPRVIDYWATISTMPLDEEVLSRNLVITAARTDPAHSAFDVLRTRLVQALAENGWTRVAITSPTRDCGTSFTAINLAITLSRYDNCRTLLLDMNLREPGLARYLGATKSGSTGDFLRGLVTAEDWLRRIGQNRQNIGSNLAIGLNNAREEYASELLQSPKTTEVLHRLTDELQPDVVLYDLPPALSDDDVIAFREHYDCVLMVIGGGMTRAAEVRESLRRIGEDKPLIGLVLNKAEDTRAPG